MNYVESATLRVVDNATAPIEKIDASLRKLMKTASAFAKATEKFGKAKTLEPVTRQVRELRREFEALGRVSGRVARGTASTSSGGVGSIGTSAARARREVRQLGSEMRQIGNRRFGFGTAGRGELLPLAQIRAAGRELRSITGRAGFDIANAAERSTSAHVRAAQRGAEQIVRAHQEAARALQGQNGFDVATLGQRLSQAHVRAAQAGVDVYSDGIRRVEAARRQVNRALAAAEDMRRLRPGRQQPSDQQTDPTARRMTEAQRERLLNAARVMRGNRATADDGALAAGATQAGREVVREHQRAQVASILGDLLRVRPDEKRERSEKDKSAGGFGSGVAHGAVASAAVSQSRQKLTPEQRVERAQQKADTSKATITQRIADRRAARAERNEAKALYDAAVDQHAAKPTTGNVAALERAATRYSKAVSKVVVETAGINTAIAGYKQRLGIVTRAQRLAAEAETKAAAERTAAATQQRRWWQGWTRSQPTQPGQAGGGGRGGNAGGSGVGRGAGRFAGGMGYSIPQVAGIGATMVGARAVYQGTVRGTMDVTKARDYGRLLGFTPEMVGFSESRVSELLKQYPEVNRGTMLQLLYESSTNFKDPKQAGDLLPDLLNTIRLAAVGGSSREEAQSGVIKLVRAMGTMSRLTDNEGNFNSGEARAFLDAYNRARVIEFKDIDPDQAFQFAKYSRTTGQTLNAEAILKSMLSMTDLRGSSWGNALDQMVKQVTGRSTKEAQAEQARAGLITGEIRKTTPRGPGKFMYEDTKDENLLRTDPYAWFKKYIEGAGGFLQQKGVNAATAQPAEIAGVLGKIFSRATAEDLANKIVNQRQEIELKLERAKQARVEKSEVDRIASESLNTSWQRATESASTALGDLGDRIKGGIIPVLDLFKDGMQKLSTQVEDENSRRAKATAEGDRLRDESRLRGGDESTRMTPDGKATPSTSGEKSWWVPSKGPLEWLHDLIFGPAKAEQANRIDGRSQIGDGRANDTANAAGGGLVAAFEGLNATVLSAGEALSAALTATGETVMAAGGSAAGAVEAAGGSLAGAIEGLAGRIGSISIPNPSIGGPNVGTNQGLVR